MQFDPTTGKEVAEKTTSLSEALNYIVQFSSILACLASISTFIVAIYIYKAWKKDESIKLLMADAQKLKREAYVLTAMQIETIHKIASNINGELAVEHGLITKKESQKAIIKITNELLKESFLYTSKKVAIVDELKVRGCEVEPYSDDLENGFLEIGEFFKKISNEEDDENNIKKRIADGELDLVDKMVGYRGAEMKAILKISKQIEKLK